MKITDEMVEAAAKAHTPQFDRMTSDIQEYALIQMRSALEAALTAAPASAEPDRAVAEVKKRDWKQNCQYLIDILDNQGFMSSDLGEEDEGEIERIRFELSEGENPGAAPARASNEAEELRSALHDLLTWFPDAPSPPEWRLKGGKNGADDAVKFARQIIGIDAEIGGADEPFTEADMIDNEVPEAPHEFVGSNDRLFCRQCSRPRSDLRFHTRRKSMTIDT